MAAGFDYGNGTTNVDHATDIRYGVIQADHVGQYWYDAAESEYGPPTCGYCGSEDLTAIEWDTWQCTKCSQTFGELEALSEDPIAWTYADADYDLRQGGDDSDIFVLRSPYYTLCQFCSPCATGAGYIESQGEDGIKAYCLGPDWFEDGKAPYAVYRVDDNSLVVVEVQN